MDSLDEILKLEPVNIQHDKFVIVQKLTQEQRELLKSLQHNQAWKLYRRILIQARDGYQYGVNAEFDPYKLMKYSGFVGGLGFALNQLVNLGEPNKANTLSAERKADPKV